MNTPKKMITGMLAPDGSFHFIDSHIEYALELFDYYGWESLEAGMPAGALDTAGVPIDRHNRNVRIMVLAGCVGFTHHGCTDEGTNKGIAMLDNPYYEKLINTLLDMFDKAAS
ncbi:hypothetical protein SEA_SWENSON_2 [Arthrobacter phage Swenson]|nr:hypothetical protein SEA_SWENSON_2 [Arthrobacter phage Swenson]